MGKKDSKPRGRMSAYAFFVQTCREEHKKKHPNENVVFSEFSKKCSERWKTMSDKEKKRFHDMGEKDKKRYELEMANYKPPKGEKVKGKKRKRSKDPNAPKRSLSAFFWFSQEERPKVKEANSDLTMGEIAKELGKRWNEVPEEVKSKYEAMAAKDKARYEKEVKAYKGKKAKGSPVKEKGGAKKKDDSDEDEEESEEAEEVEENEEGEESGDDDDDDDE